MVSPKNCEGEQRRCQARRSDNLPSIFHYQTSTHVTLGFVRNHDTGNSSHSVVERRAEIEVEGVVGIGGTNEGVGRQDFALAVVLVRIGEAIRVKAECIRATDVASGANVDADLAILVTKVVCVQGVARAVGFNASGEGVRVDGHGSRVPGKRKVATVGQGQVVWPAGKHGKVEQEEAVCARGLVRKSRKVEVFDARLFENLDVGLHVDGGGEGNRDRVGIARSLPVAAGELVLPFEVDGVVANFVAGAARCVRCRPSTTT